MKKIGLIAAVGLLLATSCQKEEPNSVQSGNEATISFNLGVEGAVQTRATTISDGSCADKLVYAVFDKDGKRISTLEAVEKTGVTFPTFEHIVLAKGQTYKVAFWAQDSDCKAYTVDTDNMIVSIDYTAGTASTDGAAENNLNNDETRDAFFKTIEFTVTGSTSIDVELKRPFAQINVGVTAEDWAGAEASGVVIANSSVVIKDAATGLNLLDGTISGETDVTYSLNDIPTEALKVDVDGDGTMEEYKWLSMSYILPKETTTGYAKTTLENLSFTFDPTSGEDLVFEEGLNAVPVQRNWRTNIIGRLLTSDITFNIVIDPVYDGDHNVSLPYATIGGVAYSTFAEALEAAKDGETITLNGEITLDGIEGYLYTIADKSVTIDLNGFGIVAKIPDVAKNSAIFRVVDGGELIITGEGNVKVMTAKATGIAAFINNDGGTVNLEGGNWTMSALEYPDALLPTFVDNNSNLTSATLNINDGTYTYHRNLFRNFANAASHNSFATIATININGGTFNGRESDSGAIWNQKPNASVPDGAGVININGGTFNNVKIDDDFEVIVYVSTAEKLDEGTASGGVVLMEEDMTVSTTETTASSGYPGGNTGINVTNGTVLDGQGKTLTVTDANNNTWDCAIHSKGGTIKNLTIDGGFRGIFIAYETPMTNNRHP